MTGTNLRRRGFLAAIPAVGLGSTLPVTSGSPTDDTTTSGQSPSDTQFERVATLDPPDGDSDGGSPARFPGSIAVSDNTILAGAYDDSNHNGSNAGSAFVFERTDGEWGPGTRIAPEDGDGGDWFGYSVALSGEVALIGARRDEDPNGYGGSSAYVFERRDGTWRRGQLAPEFDAVGPVQFVSLEGGTAVVGGDGAVHVFQRSASKNSRSPTATSSPTPTDSAETPTATPRGSSAVSRTTEPTRDDEVRSPAPDDGGSSGTDGVELPGFGLGMGLAALGGGAIWHHLRGDDENQ